MVEAAGHCLAIACPGSGKTSTVAAKAAFLLAQGCRVCAVTFTRLGALELRERIVMLTAGKHKERLLVGTFHSVLMWMASPAGCKGSFAQAIFAGRTSPFQNKFDVVNPGTQASYVARAIRQVGIEKMPVMDALRLIEQGKAGSAPESVPGSVQGSVPEHIELVRVYNQLLLQAGKVDFQDIITQTVDALTNKTLEPLRVDMLIVDEAQDTDRQQYEWIRVHGHNGVVLNLVGDDDQSIYGFRGALGSEIMSVFAQEFQVESVLLRTNYRSHEEILVPASALIGCNTERIPKPLVAAKGPGGQVVCERFADPGEEADVIAQRAGAAISAGCTVAVITRTNRQLLQMQSSMMVAGVPYRKTDGRSLFDCPEVQVYQALLRTVLKPVPGDIDLVMAWAGMNEDDIRKIRAMFGGHVRQGHPNDFKESGVSDESRLIWQQFARQRAQWVIANQDGRFALLNCGAAEWLKENRRDPNSEMLLDIAYKLFEPVGKTLEAHLSNLSNAVRRRLSEKNDNEDDKQLVWLLTAHGAKGLEFDWVFVAGMNEGVFPSDKGAIEEERRLFYVAMSRARSRLFVSGTNAKKLSPFLAEAGLAVSMVSPVVSSPCIILYLAFCYRNASQFETRCGTLKLASTSFNGAPPVSLKQRLRQIGFVQHQPAHIKPARRPEKASSRH